MFTYNSDGIGLDHSSDGFSISEYRITSMVTTS